MARAQADFVLVDTPPAGALADAAVLAPRLEGMLLVVSAGRTKRDLARRAREQLERVNANLLGVVLTDVRRRQALSLQSTERSDETMKGVILAGGTGSRLHPLTRITNKHLLPVYDKPMIFYPIETLVSAGIDEIMVVTGGNHAGEFLPLLGNGSEFGLRRLQFSLSGPGRRHRRSARPVRKLRRRRQSRGDARRQHPRPDHRAVCRALRPPAAGGRLLLKEMEDPSHLRHLGVPDLRQGRPAGRTSAKSPRRRPVRMPSSASTCTTPASSTSSAT